MVVVFVSASRNTLSFLRWARDSRASSLTEVRRRSSSSRFSSVDRGLTPSSVIRVATRLSRLRAGNVARAKAPRKSRAE